MKKFVVVFAFFMLFKPLLPIVEYVVNYDYIITELCVQKDLYENQCNGMCHLSEKMVEASKPSEPSDKPRFSFVEISSEFLPNIYPIFENKILFLEKSTAKDTYNTMYSFTKLFSIFHPPILFGNS